MTAPPVLSFDRRSSGPAVDLERLVASRALIQANSGGGKSWALRYLLEQTHGKIPHLVLDSEGEFSTLREKFDYVLAGREGDVAAVPKAAKLLCRRLVELRASAVIDLYDLKLDERRAFVKLFLAELMHLPRKLWHPLLVVIDEAHRFCLSEDTEILTRDRGWQRYDGLSEGDVVVTFDPTMEEYRHEPILRVIVREHDGEMVRLKTKSLDCLVTPDHRVVLRREQRAAGRRKLLYPWTFCPASEVPGQIRIPAAGGPTGPGIPALTPSMMRILGWILTEGYNEGGSGGIGIQQALGTTKGGLNVSEEMEVTLKAAFPNVGVYPRPAREKAGPSVAFYLGKSYGAEIKECLGIDAAAPIPLKTERRIPRILIVQSSREQLEALYQGLMEGDGSTASFYPGKNEGLADDFQEIATRLGISTTKGFSSTIDQWYVKLRERTIHYVRHPECVHYRGIVWDVTVPSGAFVARRAGRVFVTGNCPERGSGDAQSTEAVITLCTQGRKRGYAAVLATQRLSKLHKDAAAELLNVLIGRTGLDVDVKRAGDILGFAKEERNTLRDLDPGTFYAFGPAIARKVTLVRTGDVQTTHPEPGKIGVVAGGRPRGGGGRQTRPSRSSPTSNRRRPRRSGRSAISRSGSASSMGRSAGPGRPRRRRTPPFFSARSTSR